MSPRVLFTAAFLCIAAPALAQRVEISPFGGYRFGPSVGQIGRAPVVDDDGGPSFGVVADFRIGPPQDGLKFEAMFSRERARVKVERSLFYPPEPAEVQVDHLMAGGIQELDYGRAIPFIGGLVGLTRYSAPDGYEVRFTVGLSAGGKFFATPHLGLRLDARGYMTIIGLGGAGACSGGCIFVFSANPSFQADLTAGLIIAF